MSIIVNDLARSGLKINSGGGMFGLNDNNSQPNANQPGGLPPGPFADNTHVGGPDPITPTDNVSAPDLPPLPPDPMKTNPPSIIPEHPSKPANDNPLPAQPPAPAPAAPAADDELLDLKEQALGSLAPLVDKLEQSPEEKFKTTMMLIQASDNPHLVKEAYDAANQIPDEKARAQALLDVINEINYFTQHHDGEA